MATHFGELVAISANHRGLVSISWCYRRKDSDGNWSTASCDSRSMVCLFVITPDKSSRMGDIFATPSGSGFCGARILKVSASMCIESQGSNFDGRPRMQKNGSGRLHEVGAGMLAHLPPAIALDLHTPRKLFLFIYGFSVNIN